VLRVVKNKGVERKPVQLRTSDGLDLTFWWWNQHKTRKRLLIVAPGFAQHHGTKIMKHLAREFLPGADVLGVDFRGMAGNPGRYSFGSREHLDLQAAFKWAKKMKYKRVELLGFSLGAYISLRALAEDTGPVKRCYFVSGPTRLEDIVKTGGPLRQLFAIATRWHHIVARVWAGSQWFFRWDWPLRSKPSALDFAPKVKVPVHFLIGGYDQLVLPRLTKAVYEAVKAPKSLTTFARGHHAEYMAVQEQKAFLKWMKERVDRIERRKTPRAAPI
jgi:alpha-beta hydrolase superfamily lysophospholipase